MSTGGIIFNIIFLMICYAICVIITAGFCYAYFYEKYPGVRDHREDLGSALVLGMMVGITGPIGVFMIFLSFGLGKYGWRLCPKREEKDEIFIDNR